MIFAITFKMGRSIKDSRAEKLVNSWIERTGVKISMVEFALLTLMIKKEFRVKKTKKTKYFKEKAEVEKQIKKAVEKIDKIFKTHLEMLDKKTFGCVLCEEDFKKWEERKEEYKK